MDGFFRQSFFIFFSLGLLLPHSVYAADADVFAMNFEELMDMSISSATKHPEEAKNIPASVTIIPRSEIQKYGYTTLPELFRNLPGFYLNNNTEDQRIGVRGTIGGGVQFLVNGVPQHPSIAKGLSVPEISRLNIPVESIDSIEVVRGPMSVMYGNNAFKGVINIITNDVDTTGSMLVAGYGSQDTSKVFGRVGKMLDEGFVSVNMGLYKSDGLGGKYADMMSDSQLAALDPAMHTSLDGDVTHDNFNIDLSSGWHDFTANLRYSEMDYGFYAFTPSFDSGNQINLETFNGMLGYKTELTNTLTLNGSLIYSHEEYEIPQFDFYLETMHNAEAWQFQESSRTEMELNLQYAPRDDLNVLAGYRYRQMDDLVNEVSLALVGLDRIRVLDDVEQHDLFFQVAYQLFEPLKLVVGNRWTQAKSYNLTTQNLVDNTATVTELQGDEDISATPNLAAIYTINDRHVIKALYGEALQDHRSQEFSEAEEIETFELNYLAVYDKLFFSLSLFQNNTDNLLRVVQRLDSGTGLYEDYSDNSGRLQTIGTELIVKYQPLEQLDFEFSAVWQETDDKKNSSIDVGESPQWLAKAKMSYRHQSVVYSLFSHYISRMKSDFVFVQSAVPGQYVRLGSDVDGSISVGANVRYKHASSGFYVNAHIENMFDEDIYTPANELVNVDKGLLAQERQFMFTLGIEF